MYSDFMYEQHTVCCSEGLFIKKKVFLLASDKKNRKDSEKSGNLFRRVTVIVAVVLALVPIMSYLILLPTLPDTLPVKYDSMGVPSINVAKTSWDMIFFSIEGIFGVAAMLIAGKIAQGFAKRTSKNSDMSSTKNTIDAITLVISVLTCVSWFLTVIPLM